MDGKVLTLKSDFPKASENSVVSFLNRPYMPLVRKRNYHEIEWLIGILRFCKTTWSICIQSVVKITPL